MTVYPTQSIDDDCFLINTESPEGLQMSLEKVIAWRRMKRNAKKPIGEFLASLLENCLGLFMSLFFIPSKGINTIFDLFMFPETYSEQQDLLRLFDRIKTYWSKNLCDYDLYTIAILVTDFADEEFHKFLELHFNERTVKNRFRKEIGLFYTFFGPHHIPRLLAAMRFRIELATGLSEILEDLLHSYIRRFWSDFRMKKACQRLI
jgi:hypothetical protein